MAGTVGDPCNTDEERGWGFWGLSTTSLSCVESLFHSFSLLKTSLGLRPSHPVPQRQGRSAVLCVQADRNLPGLPPIWLAVTSP